MIPHSDSAPFSRKYAYFLVRISGNFHIKKRISNSKNRFWKSESTFLNSFCNHHIHIQKPSPLCFGCVFQLCKPYFGENHRKMIKNRFFSQNHSKTHFSRCFQAFSAHFQAFISVESLLRARWSFWDFPEVFALV